MKFCGNKKLRRLKLSFMQIIMKGVLHSRFLPTYQTKNRHPLFIVFLFSKPTNRLLERRVGPRSYLRLTWYSTKKEGKGYNFFTVVVEDTYTLVSKGRMIRMTENIFYSLNVDCALVTYVLFFQECLLFLQECFIFFQ